MKSKHIYIAGGIIIVIVGFYILIKVHKVNAPIMQNQVGTTTTSVSLPGGVTINVPNGSIVEEVPLSKNTKSNSTKSTAPKPIPDTSRTVLFSATIDPTLKTTIQTKVDTLKKMVTADPTTFFAWIDLGTYSKIAGDYVGAKIYWDYAGKIAPTNFVSFGNLGNMYAYNLHDMAMSETFYNQAISHDNTQVYLYVQLAQAYEEVSGDVSKALTVVARGLSAVPGDKGLLALQASLQAK